MLPDQVERGVRGTSGSGVRASWLQASALHLLTGRVTRVSPLVFLSLLSHLQVVVGKSGADLTALLLCLSKVLSTLPGM